MKLRGFARKVIRGVRRWWGRFDGELGWAYWVAGRAPAKSSLWDLLKIWWKGYMPETRGLYGSGNDEDGLQLFVSDRAWKAHMKHINGEYSLLLHDKLVAHRMLARYDDYLPELFGVVDDGVFAPEPSCDVTTLMELLHRQRSADPEGGLVVKPARGSEGRGVRIVHFQQREDVFCTVDGRPSTVQEACKTLLSGAGGSPCIVTALVRNAAYARALYPHTPNTIRVLMMRDVETGEPFIAAATHRVGVDKSRPVDNFSAGGLAAGVDVDSGTLSAAYAKPKNGQMQRFASHPETGVAIEGVQVPGWPEVKATLTHIMDDLPGVDYVGWDVLVQDRGFKIIEGNSCPGLGLVQVCQPLLADPRVRRFYEDHGVV